MKKATIIDVSTAIGIVFAFTLVAIAISLGSSIVAFLDLKSFLIVIGGTVFLTTACFTFVEIWSAQRLVIQTMFYQSENPQNAALKALEIATVARKQGFLSLQKHQELLEHNRFLKRGVNLIIDGIPQEEVDNIMGEEVESMLGRHKSSVAILRKAAEIAPAMGLIGTLIGLIQMLGNLNDPSTIGPAMAVALLTTLYGAALSYMVLTPLASKLEHNSKNEAAIMGIYMLAIRSICKKENPRRLEMLINSVLSPTKRVHFFT